MRRFESAWLKLFLALPVLGLSAGADWLQFRGTNSNSAAEQSLPTDWNETENVAWKAPLPGRGVSSPIVVAGKVVVTCSSGYQQDRLHVLCFEAQSGKPLWHRQFWATGRTMCNPTSAVAAPSPASDGTQIYAFYSSNDLVCLDLEGNLRWYRGLTYDHPSAANDVGMASSPLVVGQTVIVQIESQGESFAAGIDTASGETRWRHDRPRVANWASPSVLRGKMPQDDAVLLQSGSGMTAHDPLSGKQLWEHKAPCSTISSTATEAGVLYLPGGGKLVALQPRAESLALEVLWENNKLGPANVSPVVHQGRVYSLNSAGVLNCANAENGEMAWQLRLKGPFWATPVAAGNHLYCINQDGLAQIVRLGEKGESAGGAALGETVMATPAIADGALFVRTEKHVWKIAR